jgi:hypothetical protein
LGQQELRGRLDTLEAAVVNRFGVLETGMELRLDKMQSELVRTLGETIIDFGAHRAAQVV